MVSQTLSQSASNCAALKPIARGSAVVPDVNLSRSLRAGSGRLRLRDRHNVCLGLAGHDAQVCAAKRFNPRRGGDQEPLVPSEEAFDRFAMTPSRSAGHSAQLSNCTQTEPPSRGVPGQSVRPASGLFLDRRKCPTNASRRRKYRRLMPSWRRRLGPTVAAPDCFPYCTTRLPCYV